MNNKILNSLIFAIQSKQKGIDRVIVQSRKAYVKKTFEGIDLVKESCMHGRFVDYMAQKTAKIAREEGRREMPNNWQPLQTYCDGLFKDRKGAFKICFGHSAFKHPKQSANWFLSGKQVSYSDVEHMLLARDKKKTDSIKPDWYTLFADNVTKIDGVLIN